MFKIALLSILLLFPVAVHASVDQKKQAETPNAKLAALEQYHKSFLSLTKSKQEEGAGSAPKPFSKDDLAGSAVVWENLGATIIAPRPATGGEAEVDHIKFSQSGYILNKNKIHSSKDPVLVSKDKKYVYGVVVQRKNASHYWIQFESSQVALITSKYIASKKEQQAS